MFGQRDDDDLAAVLHQLELRAEYGLCGGGTEAHEDLRFHRAELRLEPGAARLDFRCPRLLVDAALAAWLPLEMLDRVGDVDVASRDPRVLERLVEHCAGGPDEWCALAVFLVARLLADKHHTSLVRPGAEDDLRCSLVKIAAAAFMRGGTE